MIRKLFQDPDLVVRIWCPASEKEKLGLILVFISILDLGTETTYFTVDFKRL